MTYRFRFQDQYNGEYDLFGRGETEDAAIRDAIERTQMNFPFSIAGNCFIVPPAARYVEEICWLQKVGKWRATFKTKRGDYAGMTFCIWSQRGELLPDGQ